MQRHITDRVDFSKFGVPSWRIEQRFNTGVLIGNWSEERQAVCMFTFQKNTHVSYLHIVKNTDKEHFMEWYPML